MTPGETTVVLWLLLHITGTSKGYYNSIDSFGVISASVLFIGVALIGIMPYKHDDYPEEEAQKYCFSGKSNGTYLVMLFMGSCYL